jgi:hypothetical protein
MILDRAIKTGSLRCDGPKKLSIVPYVAVWVTTITNLIKVIYDYDVFPFFLVSGYRIKFLEMLSTGATTIRETVLEHQQYLLQTRTSKIYFRCNKRKARHREREREQLFELTTSHTFNGFEKKSIGMWKNF